MADTEGERVQERAETRPAEQGERPRKMQSDASYSDGAAIHDAVCSRFNRNDRRCESQEFADGRCWATEPDVGRVANGVPDRVDRLKCLGNAVVPQQAYPIFCALREELTRSEEPA